MKCKICNKTVKNIFSHKVLGKYNVCYYRCPNCHFIQTEKSYWLDEAYKESINISDTGILNRNINLSKKTAIIIFFLIGKGIFLDYGGGYGIFVRLMRDIGFDFYWEDKYSQNIFARGFENNFESYKAITCFECFEHFEKPINEIERMLQYSDTIIFTTKLLPKGVPDPNAWYYYGFHHGQHISFYAEQTLYYIAQKYKLNIYTNLKNYHILTKKKFNKTFFRFLIKSDLLLYPIIKKFIKFRQK